MLNVLLVDDDDSLSKGLAGIIEEFGHSVSCVPSAEEAITIVDGDKFKFDVILADVKLPGMSGIELLENLASSGVNASIILMTAYSDIDLAVLALETGAFGFLRKPFSRQELEVVFRNVLNTIRIQRHTSGLRELIDGLDVINTVDFIDDSEVNLDAILDVVLKTTKSSSGSILFLNEEGTEIGLISHCGLSHDVTSQFWTPLEGSIAGEIIQSGKAVILDDSDRVSPELRAKMQRSDLASSIVAPIQTHRRCFGVLNLNRMSTEGHFEADEKHLVELVAHTLALSVENSRLRRLELKNSSQMRNIQRQLIQTEKLSSLGQLSAGIAHEINNPLTSVMGFAELLLRKSTDDTTSGFLKRIVTNADRIKKILLDLKDFYVPSRNRKSFVSVNKIIENAIPIAKVHPEASVVTISKQLKTDLPDLYCDENQILQVLVNLLINAFQAMPSGGDILVSCDRIDEEIVISVADNGNGIAKEDIDKIFDPFFTTKSDWKGTGLGLSVCYTIVGSHRGRIEVKSVPDEGTTFTVSIPLSSNDELLQKNAVDLKADKVFKVLVVDDEADCRDLLGELLGNMGFEVDSASDGKCAVEKFSAGNTYDLVCLDYKMPGMDGAATYRAIRSIDSVVKVLVLTGSIGESAKMIVELGAQGFIAKPFRMEEVETQIEKILMIDPGALSLDL